MLIAERTDRRVDDVETLGEAARCPATKRPGGLSSGELVQAIERSTPGPLTVVPLQREEVGGAAELCRSIASTKAEPVVRMSTPFVTAPTSSAARAASNLKWSQVCGNLSPEESSLRTDLTTFAR